MDLKAKLGKEVGKMIRGGESWVVGGDVQPVVVRQEPERILITWKSPSRLYKERRREFWVTILAMAFILGMILYVVEGLMPVFVVAAFLFFFFVASKVAPEEIEHRISNKGVVLGGRTYLWRQLVRFWFEEKWGQKMLLVDALVMPGRIHMILGAAKEEEIRRVLESYLLEEKPAETWIDKWSKWLNRKIPLE